MRGEEHTVGDGQVFPQSLNCVTEGCGDMPTGIWRQAAALRRSMIAASLNPSKARIHTDTY